MEYFDEKNNATSYNVQALTSYSAGLTDTYNPYFFIFDSWYNYLTNIFGVNKDVTFAVPQYSPDLSFASALVGNMAYDSKTIDMSYAWHTWNKSNKGKNAGGVDYTFKNKGIVAQKFGGNAWTTYTNPFGDTQDPATKNVCPPGALYNNSQTNSCFFNDSAAFTYEPVLDDMSANLLGPETKAFKLRGQDNHYLAWTLLDPCGNKYGAYLGEPFNEQVLNIYKLVVVDRGGKHDIRGQTVFYHDTLEMLGSVISSRIYAETGSEIDGDLDGKIWLTSLIPSITGYKIDSSDNFYISNKTTNHATDLPSLLMIGNMYMTPDADLHRLWYVEPQIKTRYEFNNLSVHGLVKFEPSGNNLGTASLMAVNPADLQQANVERSAWDSHQDASYSFAERLHDASDNSLTYYNSARSSHVADIKTYSNIQMLELKTNITDLSVNGYQWGKCTDIPRTGIEWTLLQNNYSEIVRDWNVALKPNKNLFAKPLVILRQQYHHIALISITAMNSVFTSVLVTHHAQHIHLQVRSRAYQI